MLEVTGLAIPGRLQGITAAIRPGELTAICGPNGAGKSTLLSCVAGLLVPDEGEVLLDGEALSRLSGTRRAQAIGYLPQSPEVAWDVSVEVLVSLGRIPWPGAPGSEAISDAIAAMDLEELRHRPVSQLSGGERARALVARVLAGCPRWLLADEPLANLDLAHAASLMDRLKDQARSGTGVIVVLHDLAMAMNRADRVLLFDRGHLVADGPPEEALDERRISQVWGVEAQWLGEPGTRALSLAAPLA